MSSDFQQINDYNFNIDSFVQGNNGAVLRFTVRRKGNIVPIDGATVNVAIKRGQELFTKNATIVNAPSGICEVILTRADLETAGTYYLQPTIIFPDDDEFSGDVQKFTVSGKLTGTPTNPGNGGTNPVFTVRDSAINGNILVNSAEMIVYDDTSVNATLTNKVDKVAGKGLSTNDYDNTEKAEVAKVKNKADTTYVDTQLSGKATNADLGDLTQLNTTDKTSVVNAIKEIKTQANSNATSITAKADKSYVDTQLADKATQTDLNVTNANVAANTAALAGKADKTQTANIQTQVNNLVINASGTSNPEVIQARDIFPTLNDRVTKLQSTVLKKSNNMLDLTSGIVANTSIQNWNPGITTYNSTYAATGKNLYPIIAGIIEGKTYKVYDSNGVAISAENFGWYDQNGLSISYTSMPTGGLVAPTGAKFARFGSNSALITQFKDSLVNKTYEPYGYVSNIGTIDDLDNINTRIPPLKPTILLIFDNGKYDNRSDLLLQYGFKGTFNINNESDNIISHQTDIKNLVTNGHDIGIYAGTGTRPSVYTGDSTIENAWYQYIKTAIDRMASIGVYLPTFYGCADHKGSQYVYNACKKLGIKYASSGYKLVSGETWQTDPSVVFNTIVTNGIDNIGLAPYTLPNRTISEIKAQIDSAVTNKYILPLFTHAVSTTGTDYDCSIAIYTQMLDYIKSLSDAGSVDVLTIREFYNKYHNKDGKERDYQRIISGIVNKY